MPRPALARAFSVAGIGPMPITSGSTPAKAYDTRRIRTGRSSSRATSSAARSEAVAPSLRPAALPAVTRPCARKGVLSPASCSSVVPGRIGSSAVARPQPVSPASGLVRRIAIGTRSCWIRPLAYAFAAFSWLRTANSSARALVSRGKRSCRFSAVMPMNIADSSTSFSETNRGFGSTPSPIGCRPMCSTPPATTTS